MTTSKLIRFVKWILPTLSRREWAVMPLSLTIFLAYLLSVGPELQSDLFSAINSQAPNLYSAAHQDGIAQFPSLATWLLSSWFPLYLVIGAVIAVLSLRLSNLKLMILAVAVAAASMLSIVDLVNLLSSNAFTLGKVSENVFANIVGGVCLGVLQATALVAWGKVKTLVRVGAIASSIIGGAFIASYGAALSTIAYYLFLTFYQPLPVTFDVIVAPPFQGYYAPAKPQKKRLPEAEAAGKSDDGAPGNWLPAANINGEPGVISQNGRLSFNWRKVEDTAHYAVEVRLFQDCFWSRINQIKADGPPIISIPDAKVVSVTMDGGMDLVDSSFSEKSKFTYKPDVATYFWVKKDSKNTIEVQNFSSPGDQLQISTTGKSDFLFTAPLIGLDDKKVFDKNRYLDIAIDGTSSHIELDAGKRTPLVKPAPICRQVTSRQIEGLKAGAGGKIRVSVGQSDGAVKLSFKPIRTDSSGYYLNPTSTININGDNGWTSVSKISIDDIKDNWLGKLRLLSIKDHVSDLTLGDVNTPLKADDQLTLMGDISVAYLNDGRARATGSATSFWKNDQRMNPTRWERTPNEVKLWIFGGFLALLGSLLKFGWRPIREGLPRDPRSFL